MNQTNFSFLDDDREFDGSIITLQIENCLFISLVFVNFVQHFN